MKNEKVEKLVANLHDQTEYVIYIRNLKQIIFYRQFISNRDEKKPRLQKKRLNVAI